MQGGRSITRYLWFQALVQTTFFMPVLVLLYTSRHFTLQQIMVAESCYYAVIVLFEVPTGAVADYFGRSRSLAAGAFGTSLACMVIYCFDSYVPLLVAQVIFGISTTLMSGADSAFLYDTVSAMGVPGEYTKYEGRSYALGLLSTAGSVAVGGFMAQRAALTTPFLANAVVAAMAGVVALTLPEVQRGTDGRTRHRVYWRLIGGAFVTVRRDPALVMVMLSYAIFVTCTQVAIWLNQMFLKHVGVGVQYVGLLLASLSLFSGLVSWNAYRWQRWLQPATLIRAALLLYPLSFSAAGLFAAPAGVLALYLQPLAKGVFFPTCRAMVNDRIGADSRATVLSLLSAAGNVTFIFCGPILGRLMDAVPLPPALLIAAGLVVVAAGGVAILGRRIGGRASERQAGGER